MGTRGLYGFVVDGEVKVTYSHSDSYPDHLGDLMLDAARFLRRQVKQAAEAVRRIRLVDVRSTPSEDDIERYRHLADPTVSTGRLDEWYVLLREMQENPRLALTAEVMIDRCDFAQDSLFCEWGYVIDLDSKVFEVYRGFQREPHHAGRFATGAVSEQGYAPIALVASYPLDDLPASLDEEALREAGPLVDIAGDPS